MDEPLHNIDKLFRDSLEPKAQPPSDGVWVKINAGLDGANRPSPLIGNIWTKRLVPLVLLMALCFIGHRSTTRQQKNILALKTKFQNQVGHHQATETVIQKKKGTDYKTNDASPLQINKAILQQKNSNDIHKANSYKNIAAQNSKLTGKLPASLQTIGIPTFKTINKLSADNKTRENDNDANNEKVLHGHGHEKSITDNEIEYLSTGNNQKDNLSKLKMNEENRNTHFHMSENTKLGNEFLLPVPWSDTGASIIEIKGLPPIANLDKFDKTAVALSPSHLSTLKQKTVKRFELPKSRWYVSIFAAQEWQGYELQDNNDHPAQQNGNDNKNSIKHREDEDPSLSIGLSFGYQISKKISLETGIRFGGYKIRTDSAKLYAQNNNNGGIEYKLTTSSGYAYLNGLGGSLPMLGDSLVAQRVKQSISYLGIPLLLRYTIGNGRVSFSPALGFVLNFITGSTLSANLGTGVGNDMQRVQLQGLKNLSVVVMLNPSVYYRWNTHVSFGLEPYFNYNISPINNTNVVKSYPYGIGLGVGTKYHF